jgi:hypothetical protein
MFAWKSYAGVAAAVAFSVLAAGCGTVGDFGMGGAKAKIVGDKTPVQSPDMPERPKLVMPAPNTPLPVPGQAAPVAWAPTVQQPAKQAAATPAPPAQPASTAAAQPQQQESGSWYSGITGVFR